MLPDTRTLEQRLALCAGLFDDDAPFPGLPGVRAILQRFGRCAHALVHCWRGEPDTAQQWLDAAQDPLLADSLNSRHKVVQTHLDIRTSERNLRLLGTHAQELERLSFEDSLTGIANRRRFEAQLSASMTAGPNLQHPTCVALIDLDNFKRINDTFSHEAGDDVLRTVAQAIRGAVRESDLAARLGGDEFVVLFPHSTLEAAKAVCERIHATVAAMRWERYSPELRVVLSIGVTQSQPGDTAAGLLQRSDKAMFSLAPALP